VPEQRRSEVVARIAQACRAGRQAYWVCPLIGESDELRAQAAEETAARLSEALPAVRVGLVHGRMPGAAKDHAMLAFKAGRSSCSSPPPSSKWGWTCQRDAHGDRQRRAHGTCAVASLRGRVGRGSEASTCVLLYRAPLSALARERLRVIRRSSDGFEIARRDLELRGPGSCSARVRRAWRNCASPI